MDRNSPPARLEGLDAAEQRRLRRAVVEHARRPGRGHRPILHVGEPGCLTRQVEVDRCEPSDPGLRADLVATLLATVRRAGVRSPLVWLTRSGDLGVQDVDVAWLTATLAAHRESQTQPHQTSPGHRSSGPVMVVVTRTGWRDPLSGRTRVWVRLRMTT